MLVHICGGSLYVGAYCEVVKTILTTNGYVEACMSVHTVSDTIDDLNEKSKVEACMSVHTVRGNSGREKEVYQVEACMSVHTVRVVISSLESL